MAERVNVFSILLDAICCVMCADQRISRREQKTILAILKKVKCPWSIADVQTHATDFLKRVKEEGLESVTEQTCEKLIEFKRRGKEHVLLRCVDYMAKADGVVHEKEIAVCDRFKSALTEPSPDSAAEASEPPIILAEAVPARDPVQAQIDTPAQASCSEQEEGPATPGGEECMFCAGSGLCSGCNGSGERDAATATPADESKSAPQKEPCFMCEASGICNMCQGKGTR